MAARKTARKSAKKSAKKSVARRKPVPNDKDLNDLFYDQLKDTYFAEKQILKALPKMAKAAQSRDLSAAFTKHLHETEGQVDRLERVFKLIDKPARAKTCDAIMGILDEGKEVMDEYKGTEALDAGLLAAAQAVEHYEMARYGTMKAWAHATRHARGRQADRRNVAAGAQDRQGFDRSGRRRGEFRSARGLEFRPAA